MRVNLDLALDELQKLERRIAELEAERDDLRQRLIGGVAGVQSDLDLREWAEANDAYLLKQKSRS